MDLTVQVLDGEKDGAPADLTVKVLRQAVCKTELGFAGYVEVQTPDGTEIRIVGRYDDPWSQTEDSPAHAGEHIWVNGQYHEADEGETATQITTPSGVYNTENIMMAVAKGIGLEGPGIV
jgi:hypothetical protein